MADVRTPTSLQDQASLSSPVRAQTLPGEAVFDALKMILLGAPLKRNSDECRSLDRSPQRGNPTNKKVLPVTNHSLPRRMIQFGQIPSFNQLEA